MFTSSPGGNSAKTMPCFAVHVGSTLIRSFLHAWKPSSSRTASTTFSGFSGGQLLQSSVHSDVVLHQVSELRDPCSSPSPTALFLRAAGILEQHLEARGLADHVLLHLLLPASTVLRLVSRTYLVQCSYLGGMTSCTGVLFLHLLLRRLSRSSAPTPQPSPSPCRNASVFFWIEPSALWVHVERHPLSLPQLFTNLGACTTPIFTSNASCCFHTLFLELLHFLCGSSAACVTLPAVCSVVVPTLFSRAVICPTSRTYSCLVTNDMARKFDSPSMGFGSHDSG